MLVHDRWFNRAETGGTVTYTTRNAQRTELRLNDGTVVVLNVGSRLDVPNRLDEKGRIVYLHGEAYFRVTHTTGVPFIVKTGVTNIRVLGTEFGVRAYEPANIRVAVRQGRVAVNTAVLDAGDIGYAAPEGTVAIARDQDVSGALGFVNGKLILRAMSLQDAIPDLDRWYNADIRLATPTLNTLRIDAVLLSGPIDDLVEVLESTFDVTVVRSDRILTVYPRRDEAR
jgi:ferric-dicitrate binding protein FerR (iron transport regulator)